MSDYKYIYYHNKGELGIWRYRKNASKESNTEFRYLHGLRKKEGWIKSWTIRRVTEYINIVNAKNIPDHVAKDICEKEAFILLM